MDPMTANHTVRNPQAQIDMILQNSSRSPLARFIEFPNELYILSNPAHSEPVSISVFLIKRWDPKSYGVRCFQQFYSLDIDLAQRNCREN